MIPLNIPHLAGNEWAYVKRCLDTGWVSSAGAFVDRFERETAAYTGSPYAVSCMNGTAALHVALKALGIGPGDYVIAPNLTFVATINAISYTGAEPILLDIDTETWQLDLNLLEGFLDNETASFNNRRIKAVMPVHVLGNMCNMDRLVAIANRYGLKVIEDSTEALGTTFRGRHAGTFGDMGASSFNGNKIITTGGGGMLFAREEELATHLKHLTTTAKVDPLTYFHDEVGYNYRLVNVLAAIGVGQLEQLPDILERKQHIDSFYRKHLTGLGDIRFQRIDGEVSPNCWMFTFLTKRKTDLLNYLNGRNIQSRPFWTPMNQLPMYKQAKVIGSEDNAASVHRQAISIPSSAGLSEDDLWRVVEAIQHFYRSEN